MGRQTTTDLPSDGPALAAWFAEGVRDEITALEKNGGGQHIELLSGKRQLAQMSREVVYRFSLADATLLPEDASGTLDVNGNQFAATVVSQNAHEIDIRITGAETLGAFIERGLFRLDDLVLLRKLADALDEVSAGTTCVSPLAASIFHPKSKGFRKTTAGELASVNGVEEEQRKVIEQACTSEITFVWGPPGTGKTHMIAHLIATLVARGERVLIVSHTHAAVDEAILKTVKSSDGSSAHGPLENSDLHRNGQIVRIGRMKCSEANGGDLDSVRLDTIVAQKSEAIRCEIIEIERSKALLSARRDPLQAELYEWGQLKLKRQRLDAAKDRLSEASSLADERRADLSRAARQMKECEKQIEAAGQAWFFRDRKVADAKKLAISAGNTVSRASKAAEDAVGTYRGIGSTISSLSAEVAAQANACARLPAIESLEAEILRLDAELSGLGRRLAELRSQLDAMEKDVIAKARVVAATLTKCYVGNQLEGQTFDAVVVDEISMALPPLLFIAGGRALQRVILVGDFKQLPPIVRSDGGIAYERLGKDAFHLARVVDEDNKPVKHPAFASLRTQRRMLPGIAEVARKISYPGALNDHESVKSRPVPEWLEFLPEKPLVVVDTAALNCWSGRQVGSLSRFNLYSAQISVELAAMAVGEIRKLDGRRQQLVGIVTPYAAQSRLLLQLAKAHELQPWVKVGTVHTFQGGEADLIIFDTVLDKPCWTARLCNPNESAEVRRDLNVALTRAKSKFVLVGSSDWLNLHAKRASGLGELWHHMKEDGDLIAANELIEAEFAKRVVTPHQEAYRIPDQSSSAIIQGMFDETTFFPQFANDLKTASKSIFGLVPYFGRYRWPTVEPLFRAALERRVKVTLITPPPAEATDGAYVEAAIRSLRELGAIVISATGLHGKDIVIDGRIHYTGSLNWASSRGRSEIMHRTDNEGCARMVLEYLQAKHIEAANGDGIHARTCPKCGGPTHVISQRQMKPWDKQPMKLGCRNDDGQCGKYLVDIDQRPPLSDVPRCRLDHRTKFRRVKRGRGEVWECPKHPKECGRIKVVQGDPCVSLSKERATYRQ